MNPAGLLLVGAGIFALCGAGFDWEWFMNHHKARLFVTLFGRMGARIFYGILGLVLVVMGALLTIGAIVSR